jgi:hypothetical protein
MKITEIITESAKIDTSVNEASYEGNVGIMELIKFKQTATSEQRQQFTKLMNDGDIEGVWQLVQDVTGVKLHPMKARELAETIRKIGAKKWRLYSGKGKNLGTFDSLGAAKKHEGEVQYFKSKG